MTVLMHVVQVDPERHFAFRWDYPEGTEPRPGIAPLVEFTLIAKDSGTLLRLVESGIDSLERPEADRDAYYRSHVAGWEVHLQHLREHAEGGVSPTR